jgi:hypothetical protein
MAEYGKKAQTKVKESIHKMKRGELHSGKGRKVVKDKDQAIAIGLSKARKAGAKVPRKSRSSR